MSRRDAFPEIMKSTRNHPECGARRSRRFDRPVEPSSCQWRIRVSLTPEFQEGDNRNNHPQIHSYEGSRESGTEKSWVKPGLGLVIHPISSLKTVRATRAKEVRLEKPAEKHPSPGHTHVGFGERSLPKGGRVGYGVFTPICTMREHAYLERCGPNVSTANGPLVN